MSTTTFKLLKQKLIFIINPHSGLGKHALIERLLQRDLDHSKFDWELRYTSYPKHASEIALEALNNKVDIVIAVGGDGTINEIASVLVNTNCTLGIIPAGSGNGLARHLKISRKTRKAIKVLNTGKRRKIDACMANEHYFFNVSGLGFDALVSKSFNESKKRGFQTYIKETFKHIQTYQEHHYTVHYNGGSRQLKAFMISLANSSQFGNNAKIAPYADIKDGLLDICIVPKFSVQEAPLVAVRLFRGTLYKSDKIEFLQVSDCIIEQEDDWMHLDGDPVKVGKTIHLNVLKQAINIITPH